MGNHLSPVDILDNRAVKTLCKIEVSKQEAQGYWWEENPAALLLIMIRAKQDHAGYQILMDMIYPTNTFVLITDERIF